MTEQETLYTLREAAQITNRDIGLLRQWAKAGTIRTIQQEGGLRQRMIPASEVLRIDTLPRKGFVRVLKLVRTVRESDGAVQFLEVPVWEKVRKR